jgi:glycosyltransferase involved in cell wall biosynthesis
MPRVAVVIPAYNPGDFLRRSLDSVLSQTMGDLECVVVDDGSTEDLSWVDDEPDARVRRIRQPNRGVSVARNRGVEATTAKLVAFLDQDDQWRPTKLQRQVDALEVSTDSAFCCTAFAWVKMSGIERGPVDDITYQGLLTDQHVCV